MDWDFFSKFGNFGFGDRVLQLIWKLISTSCVVVIFNGSPSHLFKPMRGIRQGDPISSIIFTIMDKGLGRYI